MRLEICRIDSGRNIDDRNLKWLVQAIDSFSREVTKKEAEENANNFSNAFSYYAMPAFSNTGYNTNFHFDKASILPKNQQKKSNGNPAALASYCRKHGLLRDYDGEFHLSPLGELVLNKKISTEEYAFILLSKQWIRVDGACRRNLLAFFFDCTENDSQFFTNFIQKDGAFQQQYIFEKLCGKKMGPEDKIDFARFDILKNVMYMAGLIADVGEKVIILDEADAILRVLRDNEEHISQYSSRDDDVFYRYMCSESTGIVEIINESNENIIRKLYPNLITLNRDNKFKERYRTKKLTEFMLNTFIALEIYDGLHAFLPYAHENSVMEDGMSSTLIKFVSSDFKETLTGLFLETTLEEIDRRNNISRNRWFTKQFSFGSKTVFLSNQWNEPSGFQLTLPDFKKYLEVAYNGHFWIEKDMDGYFVLYENLNKKENMTNKQGSINESLQQIFYGAPGTGKSFSINQVTKEHPSANVFRTTFHPDSDYSTFVGCYKPTKTQKPVRNTLGQIALDTNKQEIFESVITYKFVPQTFLKAYLRAYQTDEPVFLIIEEINRGNCAQIFGDLFQLLDRKNAVSEYPIKADEDLRQFIIEELGEDSPAIANGELCLPSNLYIWATMNTSDQSLFPIDSAFKRRWDWKYTRIAQGKKEDGTLEQWKLENGTDWWDFLKKINAIIDDMTQSADKQLGYYFCKPDKENDTISYARFVNKVLFYLWNDIFKTFSTDEYEQLFKIKRLKTDADGKWIEPHELEDKEAKLTFSEFYDEKGDVIPEIAKQFIEKVIGWGGKPTTENA